MGSVLIEVEVAARTYVLEVSGDQLQARDRGDLITAMIVDVDVT